MRTPSARNGFIALTLISAPLTLALPSTAASKPDDVPGHVRNVQDALPSIPPGHEGPPRRSAGHGTQNRNVPENGRARRPTAPPGRQPRERAPRPRGERHTSPAARARTPSRRRTSPQEPARTTTGRRPSKLTSANAAAARPAMRLGDRHRQAVRGRFSAARRARRAGPRRRPITDAGQRDISARALEPRSHGLRASGTRSKDQVGSDNGRAGVDRVVHDIVEIVPPAMRFLLVGLGIAALALAVNALRSRAGIRRLRGQRETLLEDVGLLQATLVPAVPSELGGLASSVAYRPSTGPAAGGDFYDAFCFGAGRVGVIVGDISGHGREALPRTAHVRYTLRTYLEMGLEPRDALKAAAGGLEGDVGDHLVTVVLAVYEPGMRTLSYATAGHPPPIVLGPSAHEPVTMCASPPIGTGVATGLRQTTFPLEEDSIVCFYTDGLTDVRVGDDLLGREGVSRLLVELGRGASAEGLLERLAATTEHPPDDMTLCMIRAGAGAEPGPRVEELEVSSDDISDGRAERFLRACHVPEADIAAVAEAAWDAAAQRGCTLLRVRISQWGAHAEVAAGRAETAATLVWAAGFAA